MTGRKTGLSLAAAVAVFCGGCAADGTMTEDEKRDVESWYDDMTQNGKLAEGGSGYWDGYGIHAGDEVEKDGDSMDRDTDGSYDTNAAEVGNAARNDGNQK